MNSLVLIKKLSHQLGEVKKADFIVPILLRLYLAPVFWMAGMNKIGDMGSVIEWFGNDDWGLGLPFPFLLAWLAVLTEIGGAILLVLGLVVRLISVPLMVTMLVAVFMVHWPNGWQAVADPMSAFASSGIDQTMDRLAIAKNILQEHGNYSWLTEKGSLVISNNGIEWAVTYFLMCFTLFFYGAGRYVSLDYYVSSYITRK